MNATTYNRQHTTCGHPVPGHHETTWGTDGDVFCSARCMGEELLRRDAVALSALHELAEVK